MRGPAERLRDDYVAEFAAECLRMVLSWLGTAQPGELIRFGVHRHGPDDRLELRFALDSRPGDEYVYRQGIFTAGQDAKTSVGTAVSVVLGALVERTAVQQTATDGCIDISWGAD